MMKEYLVEYTRPIRSGRNMGYPETVHTVTSGWYLHELLKEYKCTVYNIEQISDSEYGKLMKELIKEEKERIEEEKKEEIEILEQQIRELKER